MNTTANTPTASVYDIVTDRVVKALEAGRVAWQMPWATGSATYVSHNGGKPYSFLNSMLLTISGAEPGEFITIPQARKEGGAVRKGATAYMVTYFKINVKEEEVLNPLTGVKEKKLKTMPTLRYYYVFNVKDCDGIKERYTGATGTPKHLDPIAEAEAVADAYEASQAGLTVRRHGFSTRAFFNPARDLVVVPQLEQYQDVNEYYSTLFHELTHSTGVEGRCARKLEGCAAFGSETYSREELVAEMGAAMCIGRLGLDADKAFRNSVAYLQGWASHLRRDPRAIISAASKAEAAVKFIFGDQDAE